MKKSNIMTVSIPGTEWRIVLSNLCQDPGDWKTIALVRDCGKTCQIFSVGENGTVQFECETA